MQHRMVGKEELPIPPQDAATAHLDLVTHARTDTDGDTTKGPSSTGVVLYVNICTEMKLEKLSGHGVAPFLRLIFEALGGGISVV